jgi:hypothetical protein
MRLEHRTKAESDLAVAAASILARDRSVGWLDQASQALGTTLPKGAGPHVITTARALVAAHGPGILRQYAKVSFKTTRAVLENTPGPPLPLRNCPAARARPSPQPGSWPGPAPGTATNPTTPP